MPAVCSLREGLAAETKPWRFKESCFIYLNGNICKRVTYFTLCINVYNWQNKLICKCLCINYISYAHRYKMKGIIHPKERNLRGHRDEHRYFRVCFVWGWSNSPPCCLKLSQYHSFAVYGWVSNNHEKMLFQGQERTEKVSWEMVCFGFYSRCLKYGEFEGESRLSVQFREITFRSYFRPHSHWLWLSLFVPWQ